MPYDPRQMQAISRGIGMMAPQPSPFQQPQQPPRRRCNGGSSHCRSAGTSRPTRVRTRAKTPMRRSSHSNRACST